jgi:CRISPR-associated protein Cmr4
MNTANALLFLHAQTALHPGTGTALGTVDLPIQRERHTGWPTIAGSSLKGVVRDHCCPVGQPRDKQSDEYRQWIASEPCQKWLAVFGPETNEAELHAGAISLTDARILAFPVRSARSVFAWVTCPEALRRLARDAKLTGEAVPLTADALQPLNDPDREGLAFAPTRSPLAIDENGQKKLLLEEYDFVLDSDSSGADATAKIADWLATHALSDEFTRGRLRQHLAILSDTEFTHFVRHATEVAARIGLDYETKTVSGGALFYEEFLPAETLLYCVVLAGESRRKFAKEQENERRRSVEMSAAEVLTYVSNQLPKPSVLQIGGNETIGKGLCAVRLEPQAPPGEKEPSQ